MQRSNVFANTVLFIVLVLAFALSACQGKQADNTARTGQSPTLTATPATARPLLAGRIDNVSLYRVPNNASDLAISLVVSVTNAGEPGVAQNWKLEVNSPGGQEPLVVDPVHVSGVVDMPGGQGQKVDLAKEDLALKAARTSITAKDRLTGILTFVLKGTSEGSLASNNTRLAIHFNDQQGNSYQSPQVALGAKPKTR